jgi:hypothetical protein
MYAENVDALVGLALCPPVDKQPVAEEFVELAGGLL